MSKIFQPLWSIITSSASFTISLVSSVASFRCVFTLCRSQKVDRVPEYNKYCLSVRLSLFSIKGAERSAEEKESRARRNYFLRFARRANIPGKRRFNIALPHENSPRTDRKRAREGKREQTRRSENCKEIDKKKDEKKEKAAKNGWTRRNKSWKVWSRFPARSYVLRACCVGKPTTISRMCVSLAGKRSVDVQTRSHANSRIYPHMTSIMHARHRNAALWLGGRSKAGMHHAYYPNIVFPCTGNRLKGR